MQKTYNFVEELSQGSGEAKEALETVLPVLYRKLQRPTTGASTRQYNPTAWFGLYHSYVGAAYYVKQIHPLSK
jgi:hypothetical protein